MESKLISAISVVVPVNLLIEPVWNRNLVIETSGRVCSSLLIEPVWNRNPRVPLSPVSRCSAFNRTSMESKLSGNVGFCVMKRTLLIEPVWNRNVDLAIRSVGLFSKLLIEPVWNRNWRIEE